MELKRTAIIASMPHCTQHSVVFTLSQARRALPYVARIVRDAAESYKIAQDCRSALVRERCSATAALLSQQRDEALSRLNAAIDDCNKVGVDLLDIPKGKVRFHVQDGRQRTTLLWSVGEPVENAWQALQEHASVAAAEA